MIFTITLILVYIMFIVLTFSIANDSYRDPKGLAFYILWPITWLVFLVAMFVALLKAILRLNWAQFFIRYYRDLKEMFND